MPIIHLAPEQTQIQALSLAKQQELEIKWDEIVSSPDAFIPYEIRNMGITAEEAESANQKFGSPASGYLLKVIEKIAKVRKMSNFPPEKNATILRIGTGRGHDLAGLWECTEAGYRTVAVDVSGVACKIAEEKLMGQYGKIPEAQSLGYPEPRVIKGEIQTILAAPEAYNLDTSSIRICFLCRTLGCLSGSTLPVVLRELGRLILSEENDPEKTGAIIVINAFATKANACVKSCLSSIYPKKLIRKLIAEGAGRPVKSRYPHEYEYFTKTVTFMTIMAE